MGTKEFLSKASRQGDCLIWNGHKSLKGYAYTTHNKKMVRVHRLSYELFKGEIPKGLVIDHLCRNRACINPGHLEAVTNRENILRGVGTAAIHAKKTHCPQGHEYSEHNTYKYRNMRMCMRCKFERYHGKINLNK